jgi:hypothetical protein
MMGGYGTFTKTHRHFLEKKLALYVEIIRNTFKIAHNQKVSAHIFAYLGINTDNIKKYSISCRFI